jgi:hypothetical protein
MGISLELRLKLRAIEPRLNSIVWMVSIDAVYMAAGDTDYCASMRARTSRTVARFFSKASGERPDVSFPSDAAS